MAAGSEVRWDGPLARSDARGRDAEHGGRRSAATGSAHRRPSRARWCAPEPGAGNAPGSVELVEREDGAGACLHIARDNDFGNACIISDWIMLEPNTRYRYGCEIRGTITLGTGRISMMMIGEDGHGIDGVPSLTLQATQEQWQALERTIATGDEPVKLRVWLSLYRVGGEGWWGGDYWWAVENVYGVLTVVREILAEVLAARIKRGDFGEARALEIARLWLHDNPREVYFID